MFAFVSGIVVTMVVAIFFPVTFQTGVTWVRGFWDKAVEAENEDTPVK